MKKLVILILVSLVLAGCANNQALQERIAQMEKQLGQNQGELQQLRSELNSSTEANKKQQEQKTEALELAVRRLQDEQSDAKSRVPSREFTELAPEALSKAEVMDMVNLQTRELTQKVASMEKELQELKKSVAATPQADSTPAKSSKTSGNVAADEKKPQAPPADAARDAYEAARAEYENGHHQKAINKFTQFVSDYPESEYCGNAHYWKGESYYAMSEWKLALKEFQTVTTQYPNSWKEVDAQLKIGMCYLNLKEHAKARAALNIIRRNFPNYGRMDLVNHYLNQID